jgi:hypothetical protein
LNQLITSNQASLAHRFDDFTPRQGVIKVGTPRPAQTSQGKSYAVEYLVSQTLDGAVHDHDRVEVSDWSYTMLESGNCPKPALCPIELSRLNLRLAAAEHFLP